MIINSKIFNGNHIISLLILGLFITISFSPIIVSQTVQNERQHATHIDPELYLSQKHITLLKQAKEQCDNVTVNKILTRIIKILHNQEKINTQELEIIIQDLGIKTLRVSLLKPIAGRTYGDFFCFPGFLIASLFGEEWGDMDKIVFPYVGPSIIVLGSGFIRIFRVLDDIEADLFTCIGFFGLITSYSYEHFGGFYFAGVSLLTISLSY